jgi:hypothetical protein
VSTTALPVIHKERYDVGAGKIWLADTGTITDSYSPAAVGGKFVLGSGATNVPGSGTWFPVGATNAGSTLTIGRSSEKLMVEESNYPVKIVSTDASCVFEFSFASLSVRAWRFACAAASGAWSGTPTSTTGVAKFTPPNPGDEVHMQLMWINNDNDDLIVLYDVFQTGETARAAKRKELAGLAVKMEGQFPDSTVSTVLYNRFVTGARWNDSADV